MGRPVKYNPLIASQIVALAYEGYPDRKIAKLMSLGVNTITRWKNKYPKLRELMNEARRDSARESIEISLRKLAKGSNISTTQEKFTTTRTIKKLNDQGNELEVVIPVQKTITKKEISPNVKAIEVLSRKYAKEFDPKTEEKELTGKILEGFTMRELQEARKDNPIDQGKDSFFTALSTSE